MPIYIRIIFYFFSSRCKLHYHININTTMDMIVHEWYLSKTCFSRKFVICGMLSKLYLFLLNNFIIITSFS